MTGNGDCLELEVTGYANGGAGVARLDGRVVFVAGALPGERVRARVTDDRRASYLNAVVDEVLEPSEHRIAPACPAAAAGAGCCDLAHVQPEYARRLGADALADVLRRIGRLGDVEIAAPAVEPLAADSTGWRIRTRLAVGAADGGATVGLRGHRSSTIITEPCAAPVSGLLDGMADLGARPGTEIVLMADSDGGTHAVEVSAARRGSKQGSGPGRRAAQRARGTRSGPRATRVLAGSRLVTQRVGPRAWQIPATGFWQAHRDAPQTYVTAAVQMLAGVGISGRVDAWDLYGGAGVFSAGLIDAGPDHGFDITSVDLVDTDPGALAAAAQTLGEDPVRIHRGSVAATIAALQPARVVVSDPPRAGAGAEVVDAVVAAGPDAVVHVGCDAAAFARDLGRFATGGYRVRQWRAFDAFPMTHHVEAIAVLTR